jgi:hypothetical protein
MKDNFNDDIALLDRFQSFSAEVLRLSLLSIAALGFLLDKSPDIVALNRPWTKRAFIAGLVCLGVAIFFALIHRYVSTDSMAWHVEHSRGLAQGEYLFKSKDARNRLLKASTWSILIAPLFLALGAAAVALGFVVALAK